MVSWQVTEREQEESKENNKEIRNKKPLTLIYKTLQHQLDDYAGIPRNPPGAKSK